jgi:hypothetical protein
MEYFSAFPNLPGDAGSTVGRGSGIVDGKNLGFSVVPGGNTVIVKDLFETLKRYEKASPLFNKEMRKVAYAIAKDLQGRVKIEAGLAGASPGRARQYLQVAKGLRASNERIPTIKLRGNEPFRSTTRPINKNDRKKIKGRSQKVLLSDIFFGAEFGGGATSKTKQFLRHRGQSGYFFWPTVRKRKNAIAKEYLDGLDKVLEQLNI